MPLNGYQTHPATTWENSNVDVLPEEQWQDKFCINKVKSMKTKQDQNFMFEADNILRKVVKLRYTIEPTIVPIKLTSLIIVEFNNGKGSRVSATL